MREGLKAPDCGAAAPLSASVTFAQSCNTARKLLSPDKRTRQGYRIKRASLSLKISKSVDRKERNEECLLRNRKTKGIRAFLFCIIRLWLLFLGAVESRDGCDGRAAGWRAEG